MWKNVVNFKLFTKKGVNVWVIGSIRILQDLGLQALASTNACYAWADGHPDHIVTGDDMLQHLKILSTSVDIPVNATWLQAILIRCKKLPKTYT